MHSKQIYEPKETFGILLSLEITHLPTKPLLPYYQLKIQWAWIKGYKKIIPGFVGFFNGLFVGNLNIHRALIIILSFMN